MCELSERVSGGGGSQCACHTQTGYFHPHTTGYRGSSLLFYLPSANLRTSNARLGAHGGALASPRCACRGFSRCSSCLTRTPRMRRGIGTRAAAAQQELRSERQPAPTATHHNQLLAGPPSAGPLCPRMDFAAPASARPRGLPPQRAAPCTAHRSHKTSSGTHTTPAPPLPERCTLPPRVCLTYDRPIRRASHGRCSPTRQRSSTSSSCPWRSPASQQG